MTFKQFKTEWRECTDEKDCRGYLDRDRGRGSLRRDVKLAFAWLYQDSEHSITSKSGKVIVSQRFATAVEVSSHLAVLAMEMLSYINGLVDTGLLDLPVGTSTDQVIVLPPDMQEEGRYTPRQWVPTSRSGRT